MKNRKIRFRAWKKVKDDEEMIDWEYIKSSGLFDPGCTGYDWMQFTGLLDKNGEEIYENDIIRYRFRTAHDNEEFTSKVFYDEYMWQTDEHSINRINDVTVIGNIYENPSLIKGE